MMTHSLPSSEVHRKMRKWLPLLVMVSVLGVMLGTAQQAFGVEIQFWMTTDWTTATRNWLADEFVPSYMRRNPSITVTTSTLGWDDRGQKLLISSAAGVPPDVIFTGAGWGFSEGMSGLLLPLDSYIAKWPDARLILPRLWETERWQGVTYAIPQMVQGRGFIYHKDAFAEAGLDPNNPPQSWEGIEAAAKRMTRTDGTRITRAGLPPRPWLCNRETPLICSPS